MAGFVQDHGRDMELQSYIAAVVGTLLLLQGIENLRRNGQARMKIAGFVGSSSSFAMRCGGRKEEKTISWNFCIVSDKT